MIWGMMPSMESVGSLGCSRIASVPGRPMVVLHCTTFCVLLAP